ncbi:uncharacterized protein At5g41620-like isoform X2 [Salvia miltiorrhiza]|uniref:uncharacterized protein At5g41620-like isoform X2 n=1 Tax=Salvia miltiorrhiza TaxID=226208 RepID=UPI0025ACE19F|nr:uncharacterized protein At5g41620-like isoform X2 [Salvia miltiorrhiza]
MPKHIHRGVMMEGIAMPTKTRKRGCSSSSSSSSRIHHYRLNKRAIVVGRSRAGLGGSRSGTQVPTWRTASAVESPKYSQSGRPAQPVSARRLAATLWEMNEIPSPGLGGSDLEAVKQQLRKSGTKTVFKREKMQSGWGLRSTSVSVSGSLPPHLSDASHSPSVSEVDPSGIASEKRTPSISRRHTSAEVDSISNASFMEIESRSRAPTSSGSVSGGRSRLKDVSNALTTSKELLKIISRIWAHQADQPSSSMSVVSALHAELERARTQVNHLMQEQRTGRNEVHHLIKCFAEEKTSWKSKEQQAIEAAIASIAGELEVERKIRRRLECLNKNLGKELTEIKSSFMKAVRELESERRAREITEQVCNELARNVDEDRAQVEKLKSESIKIHQEAEKEREMLELADKLREGRVQMKLSEAKHQFEEKSSAISKLRKQLEVFLGAKRDKDDERATCLSKPNISSHAQDDREVEDARDSKAESAEGDHLIESKNNTSKVHKWAYAYSSAIARDSKKSPVDEIKARNSISGQVSWRSTALQRAISEGVEGGIRRHEKGDGFDRQRFPEVEKEPHRRSYLDETQRYRGVKGLHEHVVSSPRSSLTRDCYSPSQQREQPLPSRKPKW